MVVENLISIFLNLDEHINLFISEYGVFVYIIFFLIIFAETGLVITPFLPGDSLLFAIGTFSALGSLKIVLVLALLSIAAILGDTVNYWIGHAFGRKVFTRDKGLFFNKEHLVRTQKFYEKYGGKTIILARFLPIIRTFAPFVAGIGRMNYGRFLFYNIIGGIAWVFIFVLGGYFFGNIPIVKENFSIVILAIIIISLIPIIIELIKHKLRKKQEAIVNTQ